MSSYVKHINDSDFWSRACSVHDSFVKTPGPWLQRLTLLGKVPLQKLSFNTGLLYFYK